MLKNTNTKLSSFQDRPEIRWVLAANLIQSYLDFEYNKSISLLKEKALTSPEMGISKIQDPLWSRICQNILKLLGPIAFGELWKTQFMGVSPEGKVAYLVCPSQEIAETIENYHFVVIGALKEFYPSLSSIETEIK